MLPLAIYRLLGIVQILIVARALVSWFPGRDGQGNRFYSVLVQLTEPVVAPCRVLMEKMGLNRGTVDISPLIACLLLGIIAELIY